MRRQPPAPFTTATLQQEASRRLSLSVKGTMEIAQALYEGVDLGENTDGMSGLARSPGAATGRSDEAVKEPPRCHHPEQRENESQQ